jgi:hypothetical protein
MRRASRVNLTYGVNNMQNIFEVNFRASDILLDRVLNPAKDQDTGRNRPEDLVEACGIIPDFFLEACHFAKDSETGLTLDNVCAGMDNAYQMGGFGSYPWKGTLDHNGTYQADNDEDAPLAPLARFGFEGRVFCYVYDYGVAAVRIGLDGPYKIARFD